MKKNILIFISGMLTMFIIIIGVSFMTEQKVENQLPGLTISKEKTNVINAKQLIVFQTLKPNLALAHATDKPNERFDLDQILVLVMGDEKSNFYDNLKINVSDNQQIQQVGTYQYESKGGIRTVPAVTIVKKQ